MVRSFASNRFSFIPKVTAAALSIAALASCSQPADNQTQSSTTEFETKGTLVPYSSFELENGLTTIMHIDRSDPVVAVALTAHVGSAREKTGRTGFAHLFEHLLFLESENLGKGGLDQLSARIGGSGANGSTSRDRTNYFQTVPKDALEKMLWAEADKLGWFINTVTEPVLAKEKQVVKNEKRQGVDNRPYGHTQYVTDKALYPEGHPYSWQVIGSLADLDAATLDDVKQFFRDWYVPNNVILTISGDFDPEQARAWVEKYFGEIPRGSEISRQAKQAGVLTNDVNLYWEDNFARLPELRFTWPTVPAYHPDTYALAMLQSLLTDGKEAPFNKLLVDELKLTTNVFMFPYESELAGQLTLGVRAVPGTDLDDVQTAVAQAFAMFEAEGVDESALSRIKTEAEAGFYAGIESVLGKGFNLANYAIYTGDPGYMDVDLERIKAVTSSDVMRVYEQYIKGKPSIATSFVPKGNPGLALEGATLAEVVEEQIVQGAEDAVDPSVVATYENTPSSFDRTVEPPYGPAPTLPTPTIWSQSFENGLQLVGTESSETPVARFSLVIEGGQLLDDPANTGVANFVTELMDKGTQQLTTAEFENTLKALGASISVGASGEAITISGQTLSRNFGDVMSLVTDMVLAPRWDEDEFALAKIRIQDQLAQQQANPNALATLAFQKAVYGDDHILGTNILGTSESIEGVTLDALKAFFNANLAPNNATLLVVGDVDQSVATAAVARLSSGWSAKEVDLPSLDAPAAPQQSQVYFYNVPGAKQSVFRFGYPSMAIGDAEFYPATVMNYILGGGGFASRLTQELREGKGYTYGIGSGFNGLRNSGFFSIGSGVRSNITFEAADLVKSIMENYASTFSEADLGVTKSFLTKSPTRAFETLGAKLNMLSNIAINDLPADYAQQRSDYVRGVSLAEIRALAEKHIKPQAMYYVVVGDAETQLDRLSGLGFGEPVLLNPDEN
ncbi:MAG: insulinase family protein [Kordiimonadaceae bacterium]|nr:insulinase family protein [Kordiimonadaceae bacterium]MBO6567210.1 insulinase family protein [Kordiimonadaceae bacterium]MBO6963575.1 insulinase family protein [Kordiimonadaceae bacterium]